MQFALDAAAAATALPAAWLSSLQPSHAPHARGTGGGQHYFDLLHQND